MNMDLADFGFWILVIVWVIVLIGVLIRKPARDEVEERKSAWDVAYGRSRTE